MTHGDQVKIPPHIQRGGALRTCCKPSPQLIDLSPRNLKK